MTALAYRELEKVLDAALQAFASTRQKLNPYERGMRDRIAAMLHEVSRLKSANAGSASPSRLQEYVDER